MTLMQWIKDFRLAKPKRIELKDGVVLLKGFPKEVSSVLAAYIKRFEDSPQVVQESTPNIPVLHAEEMGQPTRVDDQIPTRQGKEIMSKQLKDKAISLRSIPIEGTNNSKYQVLTIEYDGNTGDTKIVNVKDFPYRADAVMAFKMLATEMNFV